MQIVYNPHNILQYYSAPKAVSHPNMSMSIDIHNKKTRARANVPENWNVRAGGKAGGLILTFFEAVRVNRLSDSSAPKLLFSTSGFKSDQKQGVEIDIYGYFLDETGMLFVQGTDDRIHKLLIQNCHHIAKTTNGKEAIIARLAGKVRRL